MKKLVLLMICAIIFSVSFPHTLLGAMPNEFCDPKKMDECQSKIDNLLASLEAFRAKLIKTKAELKTGKKLTNEEADRLLKKMDELQKQIPSTEGNLWDY